MQVRVVCSAAGLFSSVRALAHRVLLVHRVRAREWPVGLLAVAPCIQHALRLRVARVHGLALADRVLPVHDLALADRVLPVHALVLAHAPVRAVWLLHQATRRVDVRRPGLASVVAGSATRRPRKAR